MILCATKRPSYVLKGTLISALSLFAHTRYFSSILQKHNWQLFRFGCHRSVIPSNPADFLGKRPAPELRQDRLPSVEKYKDVCDTLKDLSSSLIHQERRATLGKLRERDDRAFRDPELACYAHTLLGQFYYKSQIRHEICKYFRGIPVVPPPVDDPRDFQQSAIVSAKIREMLIANRNALAIDDSVVWASIQIPTVARSQLAQMQPKPRCPEVYVADDEFARAAGMSKSEFYELPHERQSAVRAALFVS